jgi:hypothetical protein
VRRFFCAFAVLLVAVVSAGCGTDDDGSALRAEAGRVEQSLDEGFRVIRAAKTPDELVAAIDDLQRTADEHALALEGLEAREEDRPQKQALSGKLRDLSLRLSDVRAVASQSATVATALESEAFVTLGQLENEIKMLAQELQ